MNKSVISVIVGLVLIASFIAGVAISQTQDLNWTKSTTIAKHNQIRLMEAEARIENERLDKQIELRRLQIELEKMRIYFDANCNFQEIDP